VGINYVESTEKRASRPGAQVFEITQEVRMEFHIMHKVHVSDDKYTREGDS
jgi:hypothetical protein